MMGKGWGRMERGYHTYVASYFFIYTSKLPISKLGTFLKNMSEFNLHAAKGHHT